jgi:hypothetical protein
LILPGEVGEQFRLCLTLDGLRNMLQDLRRSGQRIPKVILVSEYERRDLNQELFGASTAPVSKDDQKPEHDGRAVGIIEGVVIRSHPEVGRGKARLLYGAEQVAA